MLNGSERECMLWGMPMPPNWFVPDHGIRNVGVLYFQFVRQTYGGYQASKKNMGDSHLEVWQQPKDLRWWSRAWDLLPSCDAVFPLWPFQGLVDHHPARLSKPLVELDVLHVRLQPLLVGRVEKKPWRLWMSCKAPASPVLAALSCSIPMVRWGRGSWRRPCPMCAIHEVPTGTYQTWWDHQIQPMFQFLGLFTFQIWYPPVN